MSRKKRKSAHLLSLIVKYTVKPAQHVVTQPKGTDPEKRMTENKERKGRWRERKKREDEKKVD